MKSLRARAVVGGVIWATLAILVGVFGLASFLDNQTQGRFDDLLKSRHTQAVIAVANNYQTPEDIAEEIGDPVYKQPFSGQYWQIENEDGQIFVSQSLVDDLLPRPEAPAGGIGINNLDRTAGERLRRIEQWLIMDDGSTWHIQVASSLQSLLQDRSALFSNLTIAFGLLAFVGLIGAFLQVSSMLRPIRALGREVLARWDSEDGLQPETYPTEVAPLVKDINTLLERNRDIASRSRRRTADLAHAIKTPSAIVRNELEKLRQDDVPVTEAINALDRLDAQLKRSFARMRADGGSSEIRAFTDVAASLERMANAFEAMGRNTNKTVTTDIKPNLRVRMDQNDFEEVVGNLLDNGLKWSTAKLHISAVKIDDWIEVRIEDDGPGIPEDDFGTATQGGQRLDTSKPGTGLGLAIAADLAHAYGGKVTLDHSQTLGGLQARILLKASGL